MKKKSWYLLMMLLAFVLVLAACNDKEDGKDDKKDDDKEKVEEKTDEKENDELFSLVASNEGEAIKGGTLKVAMVKDDPIVGIFNSVLYEDAYDADIMDFASNQIFEYDQDFLINDKGIASLEVKPAPEGSDEPSIVTVKIREGVKWSDGEPLKIEDLIQPYLTIGHPDYTGVRYDLDLQNIVGIEEYNAGKADTISGLKKVDETTLEISLKTISPAIYSGGQGLWGYAEPSHILKDIPVATLEESDAIRVNPVTLGAFKFDKIVPGESVQFVKNEHYWKGEPKLDGVTITIVPSSSIAAAIKAGDYDVMQNFQATKMEEIEGFDNIDILGRQELYYSYVGFKLGKYDFDKGEVITNVEGSKMGDKDLRLAMGYGLDIEQVSEVFYKNLRVRANSLIPPVFKSFHDASIEGLKYDEAKAKKLLDDAGYKDVDGDGLRENPKGEKLEIILAAMSGDATQEEVISFYLQNWKDIGLNVSLFTGRLIDLNTFYDKVQADDPGIDVFMGAWGTGTDPSPGGLYSKTAEYNLSRYTTEELETLVTSINSPKAFDEDYRAGQFKAWQEYMSEEIPVIPMQFRYEIVPVNKRVKNWSIDYSNKVHDNLQDVELVSEEAVKSK